MRFVGRGVIAAVTAALMLTGTPAFAHKKAAPPPEPSGGLVDNVNGLSTDAQGRLVRFSGLMLDNDGKVVRQLAVGDQRPPYPRYRLDGKGRTLIPGFIDAHVALMDYGLMLLTLDLSATTSLADAQAKIAAQVKANPDRKWILGRGWDAARWGLGSAPTAADLDGVTGNIPAFLLSGDGELGWVNSAALRAAGLTKVTGPLTPTHVAQLRRLAPQPSARDRDAAFAKAQRTLIANGITTVSDMGMTVNDWQSYRRAGDRGALLMRIIGYADGVEQMVAIAGPEPTPWLYDDRLRMIGISFSLDGTGNARTAWMKQAATGLPRIASTPLRNQMSRAAMDGFQIALTAHGDGAVDEALAAFAEMSATYSGDRRWRIDGIEAIQPDYDAQFLSGHVTPVLGKDQTTQPSLLPLIRNPLVAAGSFAPAGQAAPFAAMAGRMAKQPDIAAILASMTRNPAKAAFADGRIGTLEPGQRGDFLLIDRDISTASSQEVAATQILETWIGGKRVYVNAAP